MMTLNRIDCRLCAQTPTQRLLSRLDGLAHRLPAERFLPFASVVRPAALVVLGHLFLPPVVAVRAGLRLLQPARVESCWVAGVAAPSVGSKSSKLV